MVDMGDLLQPMHLILLFLVFSFCFVLFLVPFWFICKKAGFTPWLCLLSIIPCGSIILLFVLAFAEWPSLQVLRQHGQLPPRS